jgi:hypothetical protein
MFRPPRPALTHDRVRHVGQAIAVVVAESIAQAKDAAEAIEVDYELLPIQLETATANLPGAPVVWDERPNNEPVYAVKGSKEAADKAFAQAHAVVEDRFVTGDQLVVRALAAPGRRCKVCGRCRPKLSLQEEVRDIFKEILNTANDRLPICGLKQSSFSDGFPDTCTSIKKPSLPKLLSARGCSMIESLEKCYVLRFSLAEMGTGGSTRSSEALSAAMVARTLHPSPRGLGGLGEDR